MSVSQYTISSFILHSASCSFNIHTFVISFDSYSYGLLVGAGFLTLFGGILALLYRFSQDFTDNFRVEELKEVQAYLQPDFDLGSEYQFTETASRAQSRIEHFYGRSVSERGDGDSQYSGNGMAPPMPMMGKH